MMTEAIVVALISGSLTLVGSLTGVYVSQKKTTALILYRIEQLEKKVEAHNHVIERTYELEKRTDLQELRLDETEKRLDAIVRG